MKIGCAALSSITDSVFPYAPEIECIKGKEAYPGHPPR